MRKIFCCPPGRRALRAGGLLLTAFCFLFITGCAEMRTSLIQITEEDRLNAEASRTAAENMLSTWLVNSGFIRGSLGPDRMNALPVGVVKALDELDALAEKKSWTDFELGYSMGLRVRLLSEVVAQALKLYAPEVLKYVPMAF